MAILLDLEKKAYSKEIMILEKFCNKQVMFLSPKNPATF